jgi:hypothetical protein
MPEVLGGLQLVVEAEAPEGMRADRHFDELEIVRIFAGRLQFFQRVDLGGRGGTASGSPGPDCRSSDSKDLRDSQQWRATGSDQISQCASVHSRFELEIDDMGDDEGNLQDFQFSAPFFRA